jgi:hypothetical protein
MEILLFLIILFYFIPTLIAYSRNTVNKVWVLFINLLFWWTIIFWIVALIMAYAMTNKEYEMKIIGYESLINNK